MRNPSDKIARNNYIDEYNACFTSIENSFFRNVNWDNVRKNSEVHEVIESIQKTREDFLKNQYKGV